MDLNARYAEACRHLAAGALAEAAIISREMLALLPDVVPILLLAMMVARSQGNSAEALALAERILSRDPANADATLQKAICLIEQGDVTGGASELRRAGLILWQAGRREEAGTAWQTFASVADGDDATNWLQLAQQLLATGVADAADAAAHQAQLLAPSNRGVLAFRVQLAEQRGDVMAVRDLRQALLDLDPQDAQNRLTLAMSLMNPLGDNRSAALLMAPLADGPYGQAIAAHRVIAQGNCGLGNQRDLNALAEQWAAGFDRSAASPPFPPADQPLRLGFCSWWLGVSPTLKLILAELVPALNRRGAEIMLYAQGSTDPAVIDPLPGATWVLMGDQDDAAQSARVRADRLHALISMDVVPISWRQQFYFNRPAPLILGMVHLQASQGGAIDAQILDPVLAPPGAEADYCETVLRLPGSAVFLPPDPRAKPVQPPPCLANGHITFGSFGNANRIDDDTLAGWVALLTRLPTARLMVCSSYAMIDRDYQRIDAALQAGGISPDRYQLQPPNTAADLFACYDLADIALDALAFNGGMFTAQILWQGVPLIAQLGPRVSSRLSASVLTEIGMTDWIASSPDDWLQRMVSLATNPQALGHYRQALRPKLAASMVMNGDRMADALLASLQTLRPSTAIDSGSSH